MSRYTIKPEITKEYILNRVSQEQIFEYYLKVPVQTKKHFRSPLREDANPTCSFKWFNDTLLFRDWSEDKPKNCFQVVMDLYYCDYFEALDHIYSDIIEGKTTFSAINKTKPKIQETKTKKSRISIKLAPYKTQDLRYMSQYGITKQILQHFSCHSVSRVWVNGLLVWIENDEDPCLAYYLGKSKDGDQRFKIYFYKRKENRFICNTNRINGWREIPETGDTLVITKSMKDVMALHSLNVDAIAMQNEVTIPYDYIIEELKSRFDRIISFYDFDYTGVVNANKLKRLYNIPYVFLTNGKYNTKNYEAKDISDYIQSKGTQAARSFLKENGIL